MKRALLLITLGGLLVFSIGLGSPIGLQPAAAQASKKIVYVVQPGDTLPTIALRYGLTTNAVATANGLLNPNLIYVGQSLALPTATITATATITPAVAAPIAQRLHIVQADETLFGLALQYGVSVEDFIEANQLAQAGFIVPGQALIVPRNAKTNEAGIAQQRTPLPTPFTELDFGQLPLQQGSIMEITIRTSEPVSLTGQFGAWNIPFAQDGDRYVGLVGVGAHPVTGVMPGLHNVVITATAENASPTVIASNVQIDPGHYNSEYIRRSSDRQELLDPQNVTNELTKLNAVWTIFNPTRYWNGAFSIPAANYLKISSPFGTRRAYAGGPFSDYHEGTDFAMGAGTPVYAPADGVVVLAEPLTVRGNAIVIDHGWGVFTGYYHLSKIEVTVGQTVKPGDEIALSGNTGLSTGAHLHWDMRIRGLNVDPLQFTRRAFP